jgi:hypothetical protein
MGQSSTDISCANKEACRREIERGPVLSKSPGDKKWRVCLMPKTVVFDLVFYNVSGCLLLFLIFCRFEHILISTKNTRSYIYMCVCVYRRMVEFVRSCCSSRGSDAIPMYSLSHTHTHTHTHTYIYTNIGPLLVDHI